ncbi:hypothetical protein ETB97_005357 [Aspergillus alliaceus]|uniref:Uncharacterized protein n=1 Tax=Petromyces alliaceus TaxID=209559 RepID=A0A8H6ADP1_PETAA|nr:hypothetical protein ETB97_005357 [Aspergillus burnettii]
MCMTAQAYLLRKTGRSKPLAAINTFSSREPGIINGALALLMVIWNPKGEPVFWPLLRPLERAQLRPALRHPLGARMEVELGTGEVEAIQVAAPQAYRPLALTAETGNARVFCAHPLAAPELGVSTAFVRVLVIAWSAGALGRVVRMGVVVMGSVVVTIALPWDALDRTVERMEFVLVPTVGRELAAVQDAYQALVQAVPAPAMTGVQVPTVLLEVEAIAQATIAVVVLAKAARTVNVLEMTATHAKERTVMMGAAPETTEKTVPALTDTVVAKDHTALRVSVWDVDAQAFWDCSAHVLPLAVVVALGLGVAVWNPVAFVRNRAAAAAVEMGVLASTLKVVVGEKTQSRITAILHAQQHVYTTKCSTTLGCETKDTAPTGTWDPPDGPIPTLGPDNQYTASGKGATTTESTTTTASSKPSGTTSIPIPTVSDPGSFPVYCFNDHNDGSFASFNTASLNSAVSSLCGSGNTLSPEGPPYTYVYTDQTGTNVIASLQWADNQSKCKPEKGVKLIKDKCSRAYDKIVSKCDGGNTDKYGGGFIVSSDVGCIQWMVYAQKADSKCSCNENGCTPESPACCASGTCGTGKQVTLARVRFIAPSEVDILFSLRLSSFLDMGNRSTTMP